MTAPKIIAGDWTGKSACGDSADGKHLGDLKANPYTGDENRAGDSTTQSRTKLLCGLKLKSLLLPFQKKIDEITKQVTANKSALQDAENFAGRKSLLPNKPRQLLFRHSRTWPIKPKFKAKNHHCMKRRRKNLLPTNRLTPLNPEILTNGSNGPTIAQLNSARSKNPTEKQTRHSLRTRMMLPTLTRSIRLNWQWKQWRNHTSAALTAKYKAEMDKHVALNNTLQQAVKEAAKILEEAKKSVIASVENKVKRKNP